MKSTKLRFLSNVIITYMLVAFAWWTLLLYTKNQDAFLAKSNYMQLVMIANKQVQNKAEFEQTRQFLELAAEYQRQEWMIFGEAIFFVISLVVGIYLINRGYNKTLDAATEKRNFLLAITHELKSPLASIRLVLDTILKRDLKKEQINQISNTALEETERLTNLVEDLLLAAKLENNYQLVLEELDIKELVEELVLQFKRKFPKVDINLTSADFVPHIQGDKTSLTLIIFNLLENAVKYSPKPAHIEVELGVDTKGRQVELLFKDQGIGVSDKEKKKIFRKFYRVGNEDTRSTKGTGLGLYIVKEMVDAHSGKVQITNNQPKGSIFSIFIPIQQKI